VNSRRRPLSVRARMDRVVKALRPARSSADDAEAIHDLRAAIRRCRSIATVMAEVDGDRSWQALRRLPRSLFRALGALRDLQVLEASVERLTSPGDPIRSALLRRLRTGQAGRRKDVRRAIRAFDRRAWARLAGRVSRRIGVVAPNGLAAQCLALERYEDFRRLHVCTMQRGTPAHWHALRIGVKRFRYAIETLLPERSVLWDASLGEIQTLLGDIHDLDVLRSRIASSNQARSESAARLRHAIAAARGHCIQEYWKRTRGEGNLPSTWRAALPSGKAIESADAARIDATARAMDSHPRRTAAISRVALALFDDLTALGALRARHDGRLRVVLHTAARLHGIQVNRDHGPSHKAARDFLRETPPPPGWTAEDWDLVAHAVRYCRRAEPRARHRTFARLSPDQQQRVRAVAGVLRLARGLYRCGVRAAARIQLDATADHVRLLVAGVRDTKADAARLAAAKHLLDGSLRRPLVVEFAGAASPVPSPRLHLVHSSTGRG